MSIPRLLLAPTHRTGLTAAIAAAMVEILGAAGQKVRFHHLGALGPGAAWDRWEGASFLDPALYSSEALRGLYDVATRGAQLSILAARRGILDRGDGASWTPADVARELDCPIVVLLDCRGWGEGVTALVEGITRRLSRLNVAGLLLTGVEDGDHLDVLKNALVDCGVPVVGRLFEGDGPGWDAQAPGAWGLPLDRGVLEAIGRQVDVGGLVAIAGQRGFLPSQPYRSDRGGEGPMVLVAGGRGFTLWSRDSVEALKAAGARVRRLDLLEDGDLPDEAAGVVLAGHLWVSTLPQLAANNGLMQNLRDRIEQGIPTVALGGGMLYLLSRLQDSVGRTYELAGVLPAEAEILWDLDEPSYLELRAEQDTVMLRAGEVVTGWVATDAEILKAPADTMPPLAVAKTGWEDARAEGAATGSLLCSRVLFHLASAPGAASRFVQRCTEFIGTG